ncbi:MAG: nucleotidyltransferase family protein [Treponema sp.]|nr:nucleotidyltransferase family protein [Treponema sp.]
MTDEIAAILIASGFSRRFGSENKLLFPFRGKPLAAHTLDLVCRFDKSGAEGSLFSGIYFVASDERVAALAAGLPVTVIHNNAPEKGRRESVRLGVEAAGMPDYYFFFPCDQPMLDAETLWLIMAARQPGKIVEPFFEGSLVCQGSPSLFSAAFRDELLTLGEGEKPGVIKVRHPDAVIKKEIKNSLALVDIDMPEDIEKYS